MVNTHQRNDASANSVSESPSANGHPSAISFSRDVTSPSSALSTSINLDGAFRIFKDINGAIHPQLRFGKSKTQMRKVKTTARHVGARFAIGRPDLEGRVSCRPSFVDYATSPTAVQRIGSIEIVFGSMLVRWNENRGHEGGFWLPALVKFLRMPWLHRVKRPSLLKLRDYCCATLLYKCVYFSIMQVVGQEVLFSLQHNRSTPSWSKLLDPYTKRY